MGNTWQKSVTVIRTADKDVLVLAILVYEQLQKGMEELRVDFGAGKNKKFFPIHVMIGNIGESKAHGLVFLHTFNRCHQFFFMSHIVQKWSFPLKISTVNLAKSAFSCGFGHIYWRNR